MPPTSNQSEKPLHPQTDDAAPAHHKRIVDVDDELVLPMHKRMVTQYGTDSYGKPVLRLFYDDKEISFDEPELFGFGETLTQQSRFVARSATQWGRGQNWLRVQGLLEQLIEEGVLRYAEDVSEEKNG